MGRIASNWLSYTILIRRGAELEVGGYCKSVRWCGRSVVDEFGEVEFSYLLSSPRCVGPLVVGIMTDIMLYSSSEIVVLRARRIRVQRRGGTT